MPKQSDFINKTLAQYTEGPAILESAIQGLSAPDLDLSLTSDSWSIRQIVHHLADGDDIWKMCIKAALGNERGLFSLLWYWEKPQMEWSQSWHYAGRDIDSPLALLHANRKQIMELINQTPGAWEKSIRLQRPEGQEERITVGWVLEMQARHIVDHVKDIQMIRQAHKI